MIDRAVRCGSPVPRAAILFAIAAFFLFSCTDAGAKYLVMSGMAPPFVSWARFAGHALLACMLLRVWRRPSSLRARNLPLQLLRGVLLFSSGMLNFFSLRTLQLVEMVSIIFLAPLVITALAGPLLGERIDRRRWLAVLVGFLGVLVVTRPGFGAFQAGHAFALGAMLLYCFFAILTRRMSASETSESLLVLPALAGGILMFPAVPLAGTVPPDPVAWAVLLSLGLTGALGHWLLIRAYGMVPASVLASYAYSQIVWMTALGYWVFGQMPDAGTAVGTAIVVASGLYLMHLDRR